MMIKTASGAEIDARLIGNYFRNLIGMYFKILPLYEKKEKSLKVYVENLRDEMEGCGNIIAAIHNDPMYMTLLSTLQAILDGLDGTELTVPVLRQKVFGAITVCKKLSARYGTEDSE